ncbi:MAG: hydroxymethylbilane synthase [Pseudomonadota bacterium]
MAQEKPFRIGTRGSPLALWQAYTVRDKLKAAHGLGDDAIQIIEVKTIGDKVLDRRLAEIGGKGLFTKELDAFLAEGDVDCAVHSLKDVPTFLPPGMVLAAYLEREDPRDALIAGDITSLDQLPQGSVVGTASLRREALLRAARPDIEVVLLRGNVQTRLSKVAGGEMDAAILANAGLKRLDLTRVISEVLDPDVFLPAVGQGIVAVQIRDNDPRALDLVGALNVQESKAAALTERSFLATLDGSCQSPIAGHARISGDALHFEGRLMTSDGTEIETEATEGSTADAEAIGRRAAEAILARASERLKAVLLDH